MVTERRGCHAEWQRDAGRGGAQPDVDEQIVVLRTPLGTLSVAGAGLNISQLSLESGRVDIEGEVEALEYSGGRKSGGLLGRLFR